MTKLPLLCPQSYEGTSMSVVVCDRCSVGWNKEEKRCNVTTGIEHLPLELAIPTCPIQDRCQHQLQIEKPCEVRARGLVCESAFIYTGMSESEAMSHPLSFNAYMVATVEDLELYDGIRTVEEEE